MVLVQLLLTVVSALGLVCHAVPTALKARDVSQQNITDFSFWVQYAAAAYCEPNYVARVGTKVDCMAGNCPQVEKSDTQILRDFSNTTVTDTAGFVALDNTRKTIVISFRGSYSVRNWLANVDFLFTSSDLCHGCLAEMGFWTAWKVVRDEVLETLSSAAKEHPDYDVVVVGHSLGAAIATLAAGDIRGRGYAATLYAYASPRVGNRKLAHHITAQGNNYRFTHLNDPVPKLPLLLVGYVHVSPEYYITSGNNVIVTSKDIEVVDGDVNFEGNRGTPSLLINDFPDHHWYFEAVDACLGDETPLKKA